MNSRFIKKNLPIAVLSSAVLSCVILGGFQTDSLASENGELNLSFSDGAENYGDWNFDAAWVSEVSCTQCHECFPLVSEEAQGIDENLVCKKCQEKQKLDTNNGNCCEEQEDK